MTTTDHENTDSMKRLGDSLKTQPEARKKDEAENSREKNKNGPRIVAWYTQRRHGTRVTTKGKKASNSKVVGSGHGPSCSAVFITSLVGLEETVMNSTSKKSHAI